MALIGLLGLSGKVLHGRMSLDMTIFRVYPSFAETHMLNTLYNAI